MPVVAAAACILAEWRALSLGHASARESLASPSMRHRDRAGPSRAVSAGGTSRHHFARDLHRDDASRRLNLEVRSPPAGACQRQRQAAAAVRAWRLLRRLVLGRVLPAVVRARRAMRRTRCRCAAMAASGGARDALHRRTRRLCGRRRARRRAAAVAAGADRPLDGRGDRRAPARDAPGARRGAARTRAARRTPAASPRGSPPNGPTTCCR